MNGDVVFGGPSEWFFTEQHISQICKLTVIAAWRNVQFKAVGSLSQRTDFLKQIGYRRQIEIGRKAKRSASRFKRMNIDRTLGSNHMKTPMWAAERIAVVATDGCDRIGIFQYSDLIVGHPLIGQRNGC